MRATVVSPEDRNVLEQLRSRAQEELAQCQLELDEAKQRQTEAIERLAHLQALLDFEDRHLNGSVTQQVPTTVPTAPPTADTRAVDQAAAFLEERGSPVHYREIYAELERRGILIKGASPANTLLTRMLRDGRFKPAGPRGAYILDENADHKHFRAERRRKPIE
jgi:hypothetical protein